MYIHNIGWYKTMKILDKAKNVFVIDQLTGKHPI